MLGSFGKAPSQPRLSRPRESSDREPQYRKDPGIVVPQSILVRVEEVIE
jgi:hypothetical protein